MMNIVVAEKVMNHRSLLAPKHIVNCETWMAFFKGGTFLVEEASIHLQA